MAFKIYVENNHIVVQDLVSDKEFRAASKEAMFFKDRSSEDTYNTNGFFPEGLQGVKFSDIVDENEIPFVNEQAFIDFFSTNTGNFNSGGATPQVNDKENIVSGVVASGTNTYIATYVPTITEYEDGLKVIVRFTNANTSTATLNLNGLGAKSIVKGTSTALVSGDIPSGVTLLLAYDGTNFVIVGSQLVNQFFDWSPTYGGFSTPPSGGANRYSLQDKLCHFYIAPTVNGTSNATTLTVTLPFNAKNIQAILVSFCIDNNVFTVGGYGLTTNGSNILTITKQNNTAFATSGQKRAVVQGWYEIE